MNQARAAQRPSRKKMLLSLAVLLLLTGLIIFIFKDHWGEMQTALSQITLPQILLLLAVGITYPLFEAAVGWAIVRSRLPGFAFRQALDIAWIGVFGNVAAFGAGAVPMQAYYLHRCGLMAGPGVGLMTLEYVFHKTIVLLYTTVLLVFQLGWLRQNTTGILNYLLPAYVVVAAIILVLVLVCTCPLVQKLARWLLARLPKTETWQRRGQTWSQQLDALSEESRRLLANKPLCLRALGLQAAKLFFLFTIPYLCMRFMHLGTLSFWQVQLLTALMLFLSNALPNVAGMGSVETAFLLVFQSFFSASNAMSMLVLYRAASYYFVFAASAVGFFFAQRRLTAMGPAHGTE